MKDCNCHCHQGFSKHIRCLVKGCKDPYSCIHCEESINKSVILDEGENIETIGYKLWINKNDFETWIAKIRYGEPMPDVLGFLLGSAEPVKIIKKTK